MRVYLFQVLLLVILISTVSQLGDLLISYFKESQMLRTQEE